MYVYPDHDDIPPEFIEMNRHRDPSIGKHLGRRVPLLSYQGINGYLSYTMPDYDQFIPGIANAFGIDALNRIDKVLQVTEHVSGVTRAIPIHMHGRYSFREIDQAS